MSLRLYILALVIVRGLRDSQRILFDAPFEVVMNLHITLISDRDAFVQLLAFLGDHSSDIDLSLLALVILQES